MQVYHVNLSHIIDSDIPKTYLKGSLLGLRVLVDVVWSKPFHWSDRTCITYAVQACVRMQHTAPHQEKNLFVNMPKVESIILSLPVSLSLSLSHSLSRCAFKHAVTSVKHALGGSVHLRTEESCTRRACTWTIGGTCGGAPQG